MNIGYAIKFYREKIFPMQGGQAEFASALGVTRQEASAWESGKRKPSLKNLRKIAVVLGVTVDELVGFQKEAGDNESECWKDLALSYKELIKSMESRIKELEAEVKRLKNKH